MQPIKCVNMFSLGWKNIKAKWRLSGKRRHVGKEESHEMFTRTIQILEPTSNLQAQQFKAILDAGCYAGDLITFDVIITLGCIDKVQLCDEAVGVCLNGSMLRSIGTIVLRWEGVGLYKIFESRFYVVQGDSLAWQIILGAKTCATHNLLTAGAFGGSKRQVFYKKEKKDSAEDAARIEKYKKDVADNAERVERDKAARAAAKAQGQHGNGEGSSKDQN
ncbi:uncharacterized protein K444DRAFT_718773 [Hyaloscypha bicolor E]|uniref:Uncharacterized protein n=1 Tax=Hyaloscypha bicolor E TaxID=1095630 RepID=A0A2J6TG84_9HELO|nr:uncharacterized protein K444DRAFT_718773 [Hyaloscypha bicolor E]PMD62035.1 hypothetical protein K444DRAFT_718773 [Hyaloscypha bicolor E]